MIFAPLLQPKIDEMNEGLAPGHNIKIAGILEELGKNNAALIATLPIVIGMTFFLLIAAVWRFPPPAGDLPQPAVRNFGAFFGLLVMQSPFGFMAILSLFALFGVIINNSIVLVDRIDIERNAILAEDVERPKSAAETSASSRTRIRSGDFGLSPTLPPGGDDDADDDRGAASADHRAGCAVLRVRQFGRFRPSDWDVRGLAGPHSSSLLPVLRHPQVRPLRRNKAGAKESGGNGCIAQSAVCSARGESMTNKSVHCGLRI